jgi:hypothetical protein
LCGVTGFAKLGHDPGPAFLEVFVDACLASKLKSFDPQALANVINGKYSGACRHMRDLMTLN